MAKLHVRHMVGGRAPTPATSGSTASSSPSGPGALMEFLEKLGGRWNISLFHYRNHGADFGRVLAGVRGARRRARASFRAFLDRLGYPAVPESGNPAYSLFLAGNGS